MSPKSLILVVVLACVGGSIAQVYKASAPSAPAQEIARPAAPEAAPKNDFVTQTVYGFLDFTTTIGNTVMVFSPQSAPPEGANKVEQKSNPPPIETKPAVSSKKIPNIQASKTHKAEAPPETKKQSGNKGTKVVVNSVVQQNAQNEVVAPVKTEKSNNLIEPSTKSAVLSSVVEVHAQPDVPGVKNNLAEPEYDFLSKQPSEVVDETYKVINLKPSTKPAAKPRPSPKKDKENPTGLVTKLGGTIVKEGLTTVHETSVIGTYINGKYAQVLQSTSRILKSPPAAPVAEGKIRPSSTQRILKTIGPQHGKLKPQLEPTPTHQQDESSLPLEGLFNSPAEGPVRTTRRHSGNHAPRPKFRNKIIDDIESNEASQQPQQPRNHSGKNRPTNARPSYKNRQITTTTESPPTSRRRSSFRPSNNNQPSQPAKSAKSRPESSSSSSSSSSFPANPVPKVKLPRTQGRWAYKTKPKPRIAIRKQVEEEERVPLAADASQLRTNEASASSPVSSVQTDEKNVSAAPASQRQAPEGSYDDELDPSETEEVSIVQEQQQQPQQQPQQAQQAQQQPTSPQQPAEAILPVETMNIEISTPADFDDIYFEIATIKSPYTFQVGTMKNTRYVTVTSTIKKSFATEVPNASSSGGSVSPTEPLTENILVNTGAAYESSLPLDSSIATLPAITLESGQATPPLETLTETFSTTQTLLKTHMLPVVSGGNTTRLTLVQTYNIARIVTATKTLPPMEIYQFIPSKTLNEFNSKLDEAGSELHLELDFGDDERDDEDIPKRVVAPNSNEAESELDAFRNQAASASAALSPSQSSSKSKLDHNPQQTEPQLSPEQIQQLALLKYFGAPPPHPPHQPQVITTSRPVIVLETVYESHVIPLVNGANTVFSTLSRPIATLPKTSYEYGTSTLAPIIPQQQLPQVPQLPQLFPQQQQQQPQFTVTSAPHVSQTVATLSESRVLKLTFGAKTAYTTLFSTRVVPTQITTYVTSTVALQPTVQPFPGYYPPPVGYPPFPFVG